MLSPDPDLSVSFGVSSSVSVLLVTPVGVDAWVLFAPLP